MDKLMQWLAPKSALGYSVRLVLLTCVVAAANIGFAILFDDHPSHDMTYYLLHAVVVGTPLIAFFLTVAVYQIKLQRKLWRLSRKDGLTGLNNRKTFFETTNAVRKKHDSGVLLMLDADWFKRINDTYGHQAGDRCLQSIAYTLRRCVRWNDVVGRIGGEEFAVYLNDATQSQAKAIGERLTRPIHFEGNDGQPVTVTLSIGATTSTPQQTLDELFAAADSALYQAKLTGRARIVFWDDQMTQMQA